MKTAIILSLLSFLFHIQTNAQNTIEGRVTDKVTRQPLESATVTLQQEGDGNIINYTLTDLLTDVFNFPLTIHPERQDNNGVLYGVQEKVTRHLWATVTLQPVV